MRSRRIILAFFLVPARCIVGFTKFKWAGNQEAVTFLGYRPIRS